MRKSTARRLAAVGLTGGLVAGALVFGTSPANAAAVTYVCTGATDDVASSEPRLFQDPYYRNSAQTLQLISDTMAGLGQVFSTTPSVQINVDPQGLPSSVAPGAPIAA
ncbi:MAG TPA: hypothetical protein PLV93_10465, partial [Microthrixaceae bacterium]|nr:hypothetical protein [Microthrixaceae bacterium]